MTTTAPRVFVGIGSNIDPEENIPAALEYLAAKTTMVALATLYRTPPMGTKPQPSFINGVVEVTTHLEPRPFKFQVLRAIEAALNRVRTANRWAPRTIDLDILVYGERMIAEPDLVIPDKDILTRPFIAIPLWELTPCYCYGPTGEPLNAIVARMDSAGMIPLVELTQRLRQHLCGIKA